MMSPIFTIKLYRNFIAFITICFLFLTTCGASFAQYKGAPVKKDRLIQALRSKQLQTRDIVTVINSNGVDFPLTAEVKKSLIDAGARPEVIKAIADNQRFSSADKNEIVAKNKSRNAKSRTKSVAAPSNYDDLLDRALASYKDQKNPGIAVRFLENAKRIRPKDPEAYQMLGFVYLYGMNNIAQAETSMMQSVSNGGSAVFRVYHDDDGDFNHRCTGSLYVSGDTLRFESDDNIHTFETSSVNVDKIKLDAISTKAWKNHSTFKIFLKIGKDKAKFRFAPISGANNESKMIERFVSRTNSNRNTVLYKSVAIQ